MEILLTVAGRLASGDDENFVVGAFHDSALVGTVGFYRETRLKRRHRGWVWGMYVAPEWRGQGVGRRLLEELIGRARQIPGLERVLLSVSTARPAARRLYASLGFEVFGTEPEALQAGGQCIDEDHMTLKLHG